MTSASLGICWRFAHFWASLLTPRAEADNVVTRPALNAASARRAAAAAVSEGCSSCPTPCAHLPRKMLLSQNRQVQTASSEGWRDGVSNMAPFLVGEHSALPGGSTPFRSVWTSKLFHYCSFARTEVRERSQLCQGVYFQMARNVLVHFPADSSMCCES